MVSMLFIINKENYSIKREMDLVSRLSFEETIEKVTRALISVNVQLKEYDWSKHPVIISNDWSKHPVIISKTSFSLYKICQTLYNPCIKYDKWYPFIEDLEDTNELKITFSQDANIRMARVAADSSLDFFEIIENYGITDQNGRIEIIKIIAKKRTDTSYYIEKCGITDQNALIEIAKITAQKDEGRISRFIQKYGITDQNTLIEIAKLSAQQQDEGRTSEHINNYGITDQNALIEIAKTTAQRDDGSTSEYINNYGITDQNALIEIAKLAAKSDGGGTSYHIKNYGITDQSVLIEIAKLAAQQNGGSTTEYIKNYGITDQNALIEIAKLAAQQSGGGVSRFIQEYGITDQSVLIEIAKLAAQQSGEGASRFIQKYGIADQNALIEIAKLAAQQSGGKTSYYIKNYGITDQRALIEVAKLAAQQSGETTSYYIKNYGITDQRALIEIAKLAAQQSGGTTSSYIYNYGITDQNALIEIAKLAAQQSGERTSEYIKNYGITDQRALIEIAKLAAQQSGGGVSRFIQKYGITDQNALAEIAHLSIKASILNATVSFWNHLDNYFYSKEESKQFQLLYCCYNLDNADNNESMQKFIAEHTKPKDFSAFPCFEESIADIETKISKSSGKIEDLYKLKKLEKQKQRSLLYFSFVLEKCKNSNISLTEREQKYFIKVLKHPNLKEANFLLQTLAQNLDQPNYFSNYQKLISSKSKDIEHLIVPMIEINQWLDSTRLEEISNIKTFFTSRKQRESLKNAQGFLPNLLQAFMALSNTNLSSEQKLYLLNQCLQYAGKEEGWETRCKRSLDMVNVLAVTNLLTPILRELQTKYSFEEIITQFNTKLQKDIFSLADPIENFNEKFIEIEKNLRIPLSIIKYASNLKKRVDPVASQEMQRFIVNIIENTVQKERYQSQNNPHLTQIAENFPLTYQAWQAPQKSVLVDFSSAKELSMDFSIFLQQKIIQDKHFPGASQQLLDYLQGHQVDTTSMQEKDQEVLELCTALCEPSVEHEQKLKILKQLLHVIEEQNEFKNDIKDLLTTLTKNSKQENVLVVDTDDWQDLFLSGTEVLGSCQRIDGDPALNVCLMAYVLDGKNRMLAVKDPKTNKILARSIFRLLLDTKNNQPVLFQDRTYPYPCSEQYEALLNNLAEERAKKLGLKLFTINQRSNCSAETHVLTSLGSCSPYEYSDASGGKMPNGKFTINGAKAVILK